MKVMEFQVLEQCLGIGGAYWKQNNTDDVYFILLLSFYYGIFSTFSSLTFIDLRTFTTFMTLNSHARDDDDEI